MREAPNPLMFKDWYHEPSQRNAASTSHQDYCRGLRTYRSFTRPVRVQRFPACPRLRPDVRRRSPPVFVVLSWNPTKPQRDIWAVHSQLPAACLGGASRLRAGQTRRSPGTRLRDLFPAPRRSPHDEARRRARRRPPRRQDGRRDRHAREHRHAWLLSGSRRDGSRVRRRVLPLWRFGRVAPGRVGSDSGQDEGPHHLRWRGMYVLVHAPCSQLKINKLAATR